VELPAQALWRLSMLGTIADQYQRTVAAFGRVQRLHDLPVEPDTGVRRLPAQQVRGRSNSRR
jgi:ATP-binding cassette subfamily B protein